MTLQLHAEAHLIGDRYYRCLSEALRSRQPHNPECADIGMLYLTALHRLEQHLLHEELSEDVLEMIRTTRDYQNLVARDLDRHQTSWGFSRAA
jgi:hypothetical protein